MDNKTFYQLDSKSKVRVWNIKVVKVSENQSDIVILAGLEDGKKIETVTSITEGKNTGKKNATTPYTQAVADAETEINKKVKGGYVSDRSQMKVKGETETINKPMKGESYDPTGKKKGSYDGTDKKYGFIGKEAALDFKLDGHRYRIVLSLDKAPQFYSSGGDLVIPFPHIAEALNKLSAAHLAKVLKEYNINELQLDGEIYNHELGFYAVASACGSQVNVTDEKLELRSKMQFYIFDVVLPLSLKQRREVSELFADGKNVISTELVWYPAITKLDIENFFEGALEKGFEGAMIKLDGFPYEHKKSKQMFKYKPVDDGEFEIIGFKKSITGETLGSFICKTEDGIEFSATPKDDFGKDAVKLEIWRNQENYLGKFITVEYMGISPKDKKPRHPRAKCFRKGVSID